MTSFSEREAFHIFQKKTNGINSRFGGKFKVGHVSYLSAVRRIEDHGAGPHVLHLPGNVPDWPV